MVKHGMLMVLPVALVLQLVAPALPRPARAQGLRTVDIPTRPGVTQRFEWLAPDNPKAAVILFAGGHGGLQLQQNGTYGWGAGNFLVRTRQLFASHGLMVAVVDAPSDRQQPPFLSGFRQTPGHLADVKAAMAWIRKQAAVPVWLIGTSRGTQSAAFVATQLDRGAGGPDGLVLTSTMLKDPRGRPVPDMTVERIRVPTLVVHHRDDGCVYTQHGDLPPLMAKLTAAARKELLSFEGGVTRGDPCEAFGHHGFNGIEREVVASIASWILR